MVNYPISICNALLRSCVSVSMTRSVAACRCNTSLACTESPSCKIQSPAELCFPSQSQWTFSATCKALYCAAWKWRLVRGLRRGFAAAMQPAELLEPCLGLTPKEPRIEGRVGRRLCAVGKAGAAPCSPSLSCLVLPPSLCQRGREIRDFLLLFSRD